MPDESKMKFNDGDALTEDPVREIIREEVAAFAAEQQRVQSRQVD